MQKKKILEQEELQLKDSLTDVRVRTQEQVEANEQLANQIERMVSVKETISQEVRDIEHQIRNTQAACKAKEAKLTELDRIYET